MLACTEKFAPGSWSSRRFRQALISAAVAALTLMALPAGAQGSSSPASSGASKAADARMSRSDSKLMVEVAHANLAEIETGKLALEKSHSEKVKKFAQQMLDDHTLAQQQLQALAQAKGVKLPDSADLRHKTTLTAMKALSGDSFDRHYMRIVGVKEHQRSVDLLQKVHKNARDADLKALAVKLMPAVREHLRQALLSAGEAD